MRRFRAKMLLTSLAFTVGILGLASRSVAQLSSSEQRCVSSFTEGVAQVGKQQGVVIRNCLKRFASGRLVSSTPEACILIHGTKLARAVGKTRTAETDLCAAAQPGFGVSAFEPAVINAAGKEIGLVRRSIGPNLNSALVPSPAEARCQARVANALIKCAETRMSEYTRCLKLGMAVGSITNAATLQATCTGTGNQTQPDPSGRIAKHCGAKLATAVGRYCSNVNLAQTFPACKPTSAEGLVACMTRASACELCLAANSVNGLSRDCDEFDDGNPNNGSCQAECGDGILQPGEACDDGNNAGGDGCANDCKMELGWSCTGEPSQCSPSCGNGVVDDVDGEECDDGNTTSGDGCSSSCRLESCPNGRLDAGETCDDDNRNDDDGCSKECQTEPGYLCSGQPSVCVMVCGNGTFEAGETCDDGNRVDGDGCSSVCTTEGGFNCAGQPSVCSPICGDGLLRGSEGCDDGNTLNGDGCANSCHPENGYQCSGEPSVCTSVCGDALLRGSEGCDDGNTAAGDGCSSGCQVEPGWWCAGQPSVCGPSCGNGHLDPGEQCDDGNAMSGDGCGPCTIEPGYACAGQPSLCFQTCSNGRIEPSLGEQCDDGNTAAGDGCSQGCLIEPGYACAGEPSQCQLTCSNGIVEPHLGEQCDDGNRVNGDGCNANCKVELAYICSGQPSQCQIACGNGTVNASLFEQCDDGNTNAGDGCDPACLVEPGWYCSGSPSLCQQFDVFIDSPSHGTFTTAGTVTISGHYTVLPPDKVALLINGAPPNLSFNPELRTFAHQVTLNQTEVVNPARVTLINTATGDKVHDRIVVMAGQGVSNASFSPESVALRVNNSGLDSISPLVASMAASGLNLASLVPVGTTLVDQCFIDMGFLGCWGRASVRIASPPASFTNLGLTATSQPNVVHGDIKVNSLRIDVSINGSGLVPNCGLRLAASQLRFGGNFALEPALINPSHVDVNLIGNIGVNFAGFNHWFTWGVCTWPIIGDIIQLALPNVQNMATNAVRGYLSDPDGSGPNKSPVAEAIESALDGVNLSGAVGQGVGLAFDAPLFAVTEDTIGVTLGAHSRFQASIGNGFGQCNPPAGTPTQLSSYSKYEPFPSFGARTPVRNIAYGVGMAISTAGFNQLLRGQTECGLMRSSLTEINMDGTAGQPQPITSDLLALFVPEFALLPPGTPLRIDLAPTLAPLVTGNVGPNGEVAELRIAQLAISIVQPGTGTVWFSGAFDTRLGMDLAFKPDGSGLSITINKPAISDVKITVIDNPLRANEAEVETVLPNILAPLIPSLAGALSGFPLPEFLGLRLQGVEVSRNGQFLSLFANLVPQ